LYLARLRITAARRDRLGVLLSSFSIRSECRSSNRVKRPTRELCRPNAHDQRLDPCKRGLSVRAAFGSSVLRPALPVSIPTRGDVAPSPIHNTHNRLSTTSSSAEYAMSSDRQSAAGQIVVIAGDQAYQAASLQPVSSLQ
jgi:hypothetical protein